MKLILKISPPFLKKFDTYLRTNHPELWATLFHLNLYCAFLFFVLFAIIGFLFRVNISDIPETKDISTVYILLFIPATAWLIFMIRQLSLFNVDKIFGYKKKFSEFYIFIIYFITFSLPLIIPYSTVSIINFRTAHIVSQNELDNDIINYYEGIMFFPINTYDYEYYPTTASYIKFGSQASFSELNNTSSLKEYVENDADINEQIMQIHGDLTYGKISDSIYNQERVFKEKRPCLYYKIREHPLHNIRAFLGIASEYELKNDSIIINFQHRQNITRDPETARQHIELFCKLIEKYTYNRSCKPEIVLNDYIKHNYTSSYANNHMGQPINITGDKLESICNARQLNNFYYRKGILVFFFVFCFYITIFFNIFKNAHWRQFLLGLSVLATLATLLLIFDLVFFFRFNLFITGTILFIILCIIFFIKGFNLKQYDVFTNQSTIMLNIFFPILPYLILCYLDNVHDFFDWFIFDSIKYNDDYSYLVQTKDFYQLKQNIWWWTFWAGIILYFILWNTLLKKLYLKLWSLPKPN